MGRLWRAQMVVGAPAPGPPPNGWLALGAGGAVLHCLGDNPVGTWVIDFEDEEPLLHLAFGRCSHLCRLGADGRSFTVLERRRRDGKVVEGPHSVGLAVDDPSYNWVPPVPPAVDDAAL